MNIADYIKNGIIKWPNWLNILIMRLNFLGDKVYGLECLKFKKTIPNIKPEEKLINIVNFAIKNVPYYREKYGNIQIKSVDEFKEKIEFIDKDIVMSNWDKFLVDNINLDECFTGTTGGTSGKPLKLVLPKNRYVTEEAFCDLIRRKTGWNNSPRAVIRNHKLPPNRNFLVNPITKDFIFDAFRMNSVYAKIVCNIMRKYNIQFIHAYPSGAYQFLKLCKCNKLDVSFIKACMLSSESLTDEQFQFINNELHIPISITYGHSEKLILAGNDFKSQDYLVEPGYGFFELIDSENKPVSRVGALGEMVGTTFYNFYMPLIRYRTGDYATYGGCKIDNDTPKVILKNIIGRWESSLIYRTDETTTTITALNLHGEFFSHINGMQYIQEEKGKLIALIIKNSSYTKEDENFILEHLGKAMLGKNNVSIKYVTNLIFQKNGKFLPLISKIN